MNGSASSGTRILLWLALGWGALLVLLSSVLPIVTVLTGRNGWQPRISLVHAYGLVGALPATAALVITLLTAALLRFGRDNPSPVALAVARVVAVLVIVAGLVLTVTLLIGLFLLPLAALLLAAALVGGQRVERKGSAPSQPSAYH